MKNLLVLAALFSATTTFAGPTTSEVEFVFGSSQAEVMAKATARIETINSKHFVHLGGTLCQNPQVYALTAPKKSFRVNRAGELLEKWSAVIKVKCDE